MPKFEEIIEKAQKHYFLTSVLMSSVISFILFLIDPIYLFYPGDIDFTIGLIFGIRFATKHRNFKEDPLKVSLFSGLLGAFASALAITIYFYPVYYIQQFGAGLYQLLDLWIKNTIAAVLIGLFFTIIIGYYYKNQLEEKL